jgi:hypothetical protein
MVEFVLDGFIWSVIGRIADSHERPLFSRQILGEAQRALGVFDKKDAPCA